MNTTNPTDASVYVSAIRQSGRSIYDPILVGDPTLWIPTPQLQALLDRGLPGISLAGLPLRTRSKVVKECICDVLGYPRPKSFKMVQPRFPGQMFDTYVQKSNNLQVWNEKLSASRRYVLIRVSDSDVITRVKVVTGDTLALLDTTGTLTQKYQARCILGLLPTELISPTDTRRLAPFVTPVIDLRDVATPVKQPEAGELLSIGALYERLSQLVGVTFADAGRDQERNRGAALHRLVCSALGYASSHDSPHFSSAQILRRFAPIPYQIGEFRG